LVAKVRAESEIIADLFDFDFGHFFTQVAEKLADFAREAEKISVDDFADNGPSVAEFSTTVQTLIGQTTGFARLVSDVKNLSEIKELIKRKTKKTKILKYFEGE